MKTVLTIAGHDPSSGAGVTADLAVFAAHGLYGMTAITALTVQSTLGVRASYPVEAETLRQTLECLDADLRPEGVKIGMVGAADNIRVISGYIGQLKQKDSGSRNFPVVLDTVLVSSSGRSLLEREGTEALKAQLLPLVDWVTPNVAELETLTGLRVRSREGLTEAARELQAQVVIRDGRGRIGVFAKGGHLEKPDDLLLTPDGKEHWLANGLRPAPPTERAALCRAHS